MKEIFNKSFWQLMVIYSIFVTLVYFNLLSKYALHFQLFALALAVIGFITIEKKARQGKIVLSKWLIVWLEDDAWLMSTHKHYSPWLLGWSGHRVIAPGLFDHDRWGLEGWKIFWDSSNMTLINPMMQYYEKPLYFYVGFNQRFAYSKFRNDKCYEEVIRDRLFKFIC